jgi:cytochrome P450
VAARDEEGDGTGMDDEQIRDEAVTLILAGHETTANALAWTWHLLAGHPDAERRLHEEVDRVCGQRAPAIDDVPELVFTRAVLAEAMRLYPPAYLLGRRAQADYDVPGTQYVLPARTVVLVSQYLLHRDARFWDRADQFWPERWLAKDAATRHRYAYFPFGAGPRICIGEQFAWMEGALVLATISRCWRFERQPGHVVALQPIVTLRPRHGLLMTSHRRGSG